MHLSDLHLGKRLNEFSLLEDQKYILEEILRIAEEEQPDGVLIAGDVYDKAIPPAEAVALMDWFLTQLVGRLHRKVFLVSGNHDSPERIAYGGSILNLAGLYVSPVFTEVPRAITLTDEYGPVDIYLLPFLKPAVVKAAFRSREDFEDGEIVDYTTALRAVIRRIPMDTTRRNVMVCHQFVQGAWRSASEEVSVGGLDDVSAEVFDAFDYTALGHIHGPQNVGGSERVRYCGTPLKYSFSELKHEKSVTLAELGEKGKLTIRTRALKPLRDLRELRGTFEELTSPAVYSAVPAREDYFHIILTDEDEVFDAAIRLRAIYPNLMALDYDNSRTRAEVSLDIAPSESSTDPLTLFAEFFELQNSRPMGPEQTAFLQNIIEEIWGDPS